MKAPLALTALLLCSVACADEPKKPITLTAPPMAKSVSSAQPIGPSSTVCLSYARDRSLAAAELKDKPKSERLQKKLASLEELIRDACE